MALGDLVVKVGATIDGFVQAMNQTQEKAAEAAEVVGEQMSQASEAVAGFAEKAQISAAGIGSAFGALGAALGGGALVMMLGETFEKTRENAMELSHLAEASGQTVASIAELKATLQDFGNSGDNLQQIITKLAKSTASAADGNKTAIAAFNELGISTKSWGDKLPTANELLLQIADHMHKSTDATRDLGAASQLMGRNVVGITGVLKEGREELQKHIEKNHE